MAGSSEFWMWRDYAFVSLVDDVLKVSVIHGEIMDCAVVSNARLATFHGAL